ncbi:MAG: DUF2061 domain-containing protein [Phycisphaerae bacterium]
METSKRSLTKAITWSISGALILGVVSYLVTRNLKTMTGITTIYYLARFILYYCHERIWGMIFWGRSRHPLEHLQVKSDLTSEDHKIIHSFFEKQNLIVKQPEYQI